MAEKYSADEKLAVGRCVLDLGVSAREAVAHCAEHGYEDLKPFTISLDSAKKAATKERLARAGDQLDRRVAVLPPERAVDELVASCLRTIAHHQTRLEQKARQGKLTAEGIDQGKRLVAWAREVQALSDRKTPSSATGRGARKQTDHRPPEAKPVDPNAEAAETKRRDMLADIQAASTNGNTHTHIGEPPIGTTGEASDSGEQQPDHAVSAGPPTTTQPDTEPTTQAATPPRAEPGMASPAE